MCVCVCLFVFLSLPRKVRAKGPTAFVVLGELTSSSEPAVGNASAPAKASAAGTELKGLPYNIVNRSVNHSIRFRQIPSGNLSFSLFLSFFLSLFLSFFLFDDP